MYAKSKSLLLALALLVGLVFAGHVTMAGPAEAATKPTVTSVSPSTGWTTGGATVTITGTALSGVTKVVFGTGVASDLVVVSDTELRVSSPPRSSTGKVDVKVTSSAGTSATATAAKFTYIKPSISSVSPVAGPQAGGTRVTIKGTYLSTATAVSFGGSAGTGLTVVSATQLTVTTPPGAGLSDVTVSFSDTAPVTVAKKFTFANPPTLTSVSPNGGPMAGGTTVTVTGTNFTSASKVVFGSTKGTGLVVLSDTQLQVVAPARTTAGQVDIRVTNAVGTTPVVAADRYVYFAAPTVSAITPTEGPLAGGTRVTVTGTNLTTVTEVTFGGVPGTDLQLQSAGQLAVTAPVRSAPGDVDVVVTTRGGSTAPGSAVFTYKGRNLPVLTVSGTITQNTTWSPDIASVYHVSGPLTVNPGATLTIAAGTTVKVEGQGLLVDGGLAIAGTANAPVILTSYLDDSVVGDTNQDGDGTTPRNNVWTGISVRTGGSLTATHALMSYGTYLSGSSSAVFSVADSVFSHGVSVQAAYTNGASVTGSTFVDGGAIDVYSDNSDAGQVTVSGNTLTGVGPVDAGIDVTLRYASSAPVVMNNRVNGASSQGYSDAADAGRAIRVVARYLDASKLTGNTADGNTQNALFVGGGLVGDTTLPTSGLPWVVSGDTYTSEFGAGLGVPAGVTFTVPAGAVLKFERSSYRPVLTVDGSLVVAGTAQAPVTLTSSRDDSVGGDLNGNGTTSGPAVDDWSGVQSRTGATVSVAYSRIAYGSAIDASSTSGFSLTNSALSQGVDIHVSGTAADNSAIVVAGNVLTSVGDSQAGISVSAPSSTVPVTVQNNSVKGVTGGVGSPDYGHAYLVNGRIDPAKLTGNTASGNTHNAMFVSGVVGTTGSLPTSGVPWVVDSNYANRPGSCCYNGLVVDSGVTLTVPAGVVLKFDRGAGMVVAGRVLVSGTSTKPVVMTSIHDDSAGGDTLADGGAQAPGPGDWYGFYIIEDGKVESSALTARYADTLVSAQATSGSYFRVSTVTDTNRLVQVSSGTVVMRGSFTLTDQGSWVTACSWDTTTCFADVAWSTWGGGGLFTADGIPKACGRVVVDPVAGASRPAAQDYVDAPECYGSSSLTTRVNAAAAYQTQRISGFDSDCSTNGTSCDRSASYRSCLRSNVNASLSAAGLSNLGSGNDVFALTAQRVGDAIAANSVANASSTTAALSGARKVSGAVDVWRAFETASYNCN